MKAANEVLSTDNPTAVTFDTLAAVKVLKETGLDDRQAGAIVATISKAMSETVATKADLKLQDVATKAEFQAVRAEMKAGFQAVRAEMKTGFQAVWAEMKLLEQSFENRFDRLEQSMASLQNKIIIKLGALMVTMAFLFLAIGPFYIRWVLSMMGTG